MAGADDDDIRSHSRLGHDAKVIERLRVPSGPAGSLSMVSSAIQDALRVSWVTVTWSLAAGVAALVVGLAVGSLSLGGLGAGVLIDVISSAVLIWRFRKERSVDDGAAAEFPETAEQRAQHVAAGGLLAIAAVLLVTSVQHLVIEAKPDASIAALSPAIANLVVLPLIARWKYRVAEAVASPALRTDAHITMVGTGTAALALVGLGLDRAFGWWWADAGAAMAIGVIASVQGTRSLVATRAGDS